MRRTRHYVAPVDASAAIAAVSPLELPDHGRRDNSSNRDRAAGFRRVFRERVRAARKARGFTHTDMARLLGVSRYAYEKYETRSLLPLHLAEQFAAVTGVQLSELFGAPPGLRWR